MLPAFALGASEDPEVVCHVHEGGALDVKEAYAPPCGEEDYACEGCSDASSFGLLS